MSCLNNIIVSVSGLASSISTLVSGLNHIEDEVKQARARVLSAQDRFIEVMEVMPITANNSVSDRDCASHSSSKSALRLMRCLNSEPLLKQILGIYSAITAKALTHQTRQNQKTSSP